MPTDRGLLPSRPRHARNRHYTMPVTGPLSLEVISRLAVGVGLHLLSLALTRTVAGMSLPAMKGPSAPRASARRSGMVCPCVAEVITQVSKGADKS